ncbi:DUF423 domain-containing protein [Kushneria phosphatilytica]|uniref:DUF423 domain-containing protein n=1 Tax=Kushneria phosphatilytica TaxID=657387 RepID=A0A1S1NR11_9GAMM|nr:DUF423 domain-containing protein [Kushneria phosphatilytica]OHV08347.1 hypothetical protein BH688_13570 [Kushneria phosphatilytica]QEL09762.1 DUF423 domain-containing protein [Kushneria phosphatilytica]
MSQRHAWALVGVSGLLTVILGALGAHGLADRLNATALNAFHTGVRYQAWHTLAAMAVLIWRVQHPLRGQRLALCLWGIGVLLFSGSLYALSLGAPGWLGPITPLGGLALMLGWLVVAIAGFRARHG